MSFPPKQVRIKVKERSHMQCLKTMKLSNFSFFATHTLVSLIFLVGVVVGRGWGGGDLLFSSFFNDCLWQLNAGTQFRSLEF